MNNEVFEDFLKTLKESKEQLDIRRAAFQKAQQLPLPEERFSRRRIRTTFAHVPLAAMSIAKDAGPAAPQPETRHPLTNKLDFLHEAFSTTKEISVEANSEKEDPINISIQSTNEKQAQFPTIVIRAGKGSQSRIILDTTMSHDHVFISNALHIVLEEGAALELVTVNRGKGTGWQYSREHVFLGDKSNLLWIDLAVGRGLKKVTKKAHLEGKGSEARFYGMFDLKHHDHLDFMGGLEHLGVGTNGDVLIKGTLKDKSAIVFEGVLKVGKGASKTESSLYDHTLVLSNDVKMDSVPGLEIENNDVRVRHGATASPVSSEQIFYLESRGIESKDAKEMIVQGFTHPILEKMSTQTRAVIETIL